MRHAPMDLIVGCRVPRVRGLGIGGVTRGVRAARRTAAGASAVRRGGAGAAVRGGARGVRHRPHPHLPLPLPETRRPRPRPGAVQNQPRPPSTSCL